MMSLPLWVLLLLFLPALLNLWAIWHAYNHNFPSSQERVLWMCAGVFLPVVGGLLYALVGFRRVLKE